MEDVVSRVPTLSFIDMSKVLVFARGGRTHAEGAYATCHCICLPPSEPGYYFWRDRKTGRLTRRSEWFVTKSPAGDDRHAADRLHDFVRAAALLRSAAVALAQAGALRGPAELDREARHDRPRAVSHRSASGPGIRRMERADGTYSANCHGDRFFEDVVEMVKQYLDTQARSGRSTTSCSTASTR